MMGITRHSLSGGDVHTDDPKTNGCPPPPPDRDGDGVPDNVDACPDVAGVRTDDPKTNGCPPDRDGDGVLDKDDACPDVPGIKTDDPKTNGCPDTDRDKDGIPNDVDACPDQAGPKSEDPKTNGCPRVFIKNGLIQILEQPKFDFNKAALKAESDGLLTEVAKVMNEHAEIKRVRVEGHTDNVGSADYNKKLSQQRAEAVTKWLSGHGIAAERLTAKGMGKESPLAPNDTEVNRALNRRVEFHIEDQEQGRRPAKEARGHVESSWEWPLRWWCCVLRARGLRRRAGHGWSRRRCGRSPRRDHLSGAFGWGHERELRVRCESQRHHSRVRDRVGRPCLDCRTRPGGGRRRLRAHGPLGSSAPG